MIDASSRRVGLILHDIAILGEIISELHEKSMEAGQMEIPAAWFGWLGRQAVRLADEANDAITDKVKA